MMISINIDNKHSLNNYDSTIMMVIILARLQPTLSINFFTLTKAR